MPSSEIDRKPEQGPEPKDAENPKEEEKNIDRDGREKQPSEHTDRK